MTMTELEQLTLFGGVEPIRRRRQRRSRIEELQAKLKASEAENARLRELNRDLSMALRQAHQL